MTATLIQGDATRLPLAGASVDAVVCDPPYGLEFMGKDWDGADGFRRSLNASDVGRPNVFGRTSARGPEYRAGVLFQRWCERWTGEALRVLKPGGHLIAFGGTRTHHRLWCAVEDAGFEVRDTIGDLGMLGWIFGSGFPKSAKPLDGMRSLPRTTTREEWRAFYRRARQMTGTALKPAWEPILWARKPLVGTIAQNVLAHGTAALNIDGCRIGTGEGRGRDGEPTAVTRYGDRGIGFQPTPGPRGGSDKGRWPANLVLDEAAAARLDAEVGKRPAGGTLTGDEPRSDGFSGVVYGNGATPRPWDSYGDSGGPSRFFYTAKAPRREREAGLDGLEPTRRTDNESRDDDAPGSNHPRLRTSERRNDHPTVKPLALMRWLVRLVTPPGGLVLDPFLGSGTTGMAALDEGCAFVGLDLEPHYLAIARRRIAHRHLLTPETVAPTAERLQGALL